MKMPEVKLNDELNPASRLMPTNAGGSVEFTRYRIESSQQLVGFRDLDHWARRMIPLWHAITERCRQRDISETDRLKLLCYHLLKESEEMKERELRRLEQEGPPKWTSAR